MKAKIAMKRLPLASVVALTFAALVSQQAHATVVTFDDLAGLGAVVSMVLGYCALLSDRTVIKT
jgi:hypothetical protein